MIKLLHGDCMELLKNIPDKSIDLVVTDPPYLIETDGAGIFGKKSDTNSEMYKEKWGGERFVMKEIDSMKDGISTYILDELCRVMKHINCYFFCSQKQLPILYEYFVTKKKCNWNLLTWHKTNPIPTCGNKYLSDTEFIMFFREKGVKIYGSFKSKFTYYITSINKTDKEKYGHPTIKPLEIIKNLIINSSCGGGVILDPYMGSGTTGVACKELERDFIGIEIKKEYFEICKKRIGIADIQEPAIEKINDEKIQGEFNFE